MNDNFLSYKKSFDNDGYFICKNFFSKSFITVLANEIDKSNNTIKYYDNLKFLRRIEKIYDKGKQLKKLNEEISTLLKNVFNESFLI